MVVDRLSTAMGVGITIQGQHPAFIPSFSSSFTSRSSHSSSKWDIKKSNSNSISRSEGMTMVVDRLSPTCIAALQTAHRIGNEFALRVLKNEVITVGLIQHPEKSIRTLVRYNLQYTPLVKASASAVLIGNGFQLKRKVNKETMKESDRQLPFSEEAKGLLSKAGKVADHFGEKEIATEHVLLASVGYNFGKPLDLDNIPVGFTVLLNTETPMQPNSDTDDDTDDDHTDYHDDYHDDDDDTSKASKPKKQKFTAYQFCEDLVADITSSYDWKRENEQVKALAQLNADEVVVIGGDSGATNTLAEVGVDLTQMAIEGQLDLVYGRAEEMRMALRTLGRRRKNNPCLIGDPGVGKTAIAEGIAQVIATSYQKKDDKTKGKSNAKNNKDSSNGIKLPKFKNPFS